MRITVWLTDIARGPHAVGKESREAEQAKRCVLGFCRQDPWLVLKRGDPGYTYDGQARGLRKQLGSVGG